MTTDGMCIAVRHWVVIAYAYGTITRLLDGLENDKVHFGKQSRVVTASYYEYSSSCPDVIPSAVACTTGRMRGRLKSVWRSQVPVISIPVLAVSLFAFVKEWKSLWVCSLAVRSPHCTAACTNCAKPGQLHVLACHLDNACMYLCLYYTVCAAHSWPWHLWCVCSLGRSAGHSTIWHAA